MTKNTKIAAIVSAAALLVIGASMTSFAATGWQQEDGTWRYYDKSGNVVTSTWEKSGSQWFWLDENGDMAEDVIVEDNDNYYYVGTNGAMATNQWVEVDNSDDDDEDAPATVWYYFQNNGKAYKASSSSGNTSFKTINGKKYAFDSDGKMLFGWVNSDSTRATGDNGWEEAVYYCGNSDDGAQMYNSWGQIHVIDDDEDDEDQDYWFYFQSNGKKYSPAVSNYSSDKIYQKTINGRKYTFADDGHMLSEWVATPYDATVTDASLYSYFSSPEDGAKVVKGWFRVLPDENFDYDDSDEADANERWFYADGSGNLITSKIKTINGKKYAFDENGEMLWGLRWLQFDENGDMSGYSTDEIDDTEKLEAFTFNDDLDQEIYTEGKSGLYYFGDEVADGSMKTGAVNLTVDGDSYSFKFKASGSYKGVGLDGKDGNSYYINGRKVKADSDVKYQIYEIELDEDGNFASFKGKVAASKLMVSGAGESDKYAGSKSAINSDGNYILISSNGTLVKSGTKKDGDDYKIVVTKSQVVGIYQEY